MTNSSKISLLGYFFQSNKGLKRVKRRLKNSLTVIHLGNPLKGPHGGIKTTRFSFPLNLFPTN